MAVLPEHVVVGEAAVDEVEELAFRHVPEFLFLDVPEADVFHTILLVVLFGCTTLIRLVVRRVVTAACSSGRPQASPGALGPPSGPQAKNPQTPAPGGF